MLYVFHVDKGRMMSFDMAVALSSVENLKDTIERMHGIPAINIVLLVSGGEMLTPSTQVSYYSAGTDTNPIYMFLTGDPRTPPPLPANEPDRDLGEQVERCKQLPPIYSSVEKRAQLALKMYEYARDEENLCERLVHDQHLQQQGWYAVVANMEDLIDEFRLRFTNFSTAFDRHLEKRDGYMELLNKFTDDLTMLGRIPILPGLMSMAEEDFHGFDDFLDADEVFSRSQSTQKSVLVAGGVPAQQTGNTEESETPSAHSDNTPIADEKNSKSPIKQAKKGTELAEDTTSSAVATVNPHISSGSSSRPTLNLLQWIISKENQNRLHIMCEECIQGLSAFDKDIYAQLKSEMQHILKQAEQTDVREIKGLGDRLCRLEQLRYQIKRFVQDQKVLSTAFQQNQSRANDLNDPSILPDLCASHQSQLAVMVTNHQKVREIRRMVSKAKDELGLNLHMRLTRIVHVENSMSEFDNRLLFYLRCLRRAERHLQIIEQIHQAPCMYVAAVTEVVRRKMFSGEFRIWATKLAEDLEIIHNEEIKRRQQFNETFDGHFLSKLFPGMNDMPPAFANESPTIFDARLPNITKSDIDMLSSYLPDMVPRILLPDMGPVINFFVSRSGPHQKERMEELVSQQVVSVLGTSAEVEAEEEEDTNALSAGEKPPVSQRLGELQKIGDGCEGSETDTENEFEKVTATQSTAPTLITTATSTITVETIARSAATSLLLTQNAETLTDESESSARAEVERLRGILSAMYKLSSECIRLSRADLEHCRTGVASYREDLQSELQMLHDQWNLIRMQSEQREQLLLQTQELLNETAQQREYELAALRQKLCEAEQLQPQLEDLNEKLSSAELEKERAVASAREELLHEHKSEIESLRCRYKLMTSMELSPSETSLEKLERPPPNIEQNTIDRSEHELIIAQLRASFETEKEKAIAAALDVERAIWQTKFSLNSESVIGNVNILKEMLEEKDRQLDLVRKQNLLLTKEIYQLKLRFDSLTNEEGNSWLKEKIEYLDRDKKRLEKELIIEKERSKRLEMETSFAALKASSSSHKYLLLDSCNKGDVVFVVWSMRHNQYMVVQDSPILYFVHGDCLSAMNLRMPVTPSPSESTILENMLLPVPYYAIGRVIDREFCQAKKDENRYRVSKGTKFYRIKLVPLSSMQHLAGRREKIDTSLCASTSTSFSQCDPSTDNESTALLPSGCKALVPVIGCNQASPTLRQPQFSPNISTIDEIITATTTTTTTAIKDVVDFTTPVTKTEATSEAVIKAIPVDDGDNPVAGETGERCRYTSFSIEDDTEDLPTLTSTPTSMRSMPSQQLTLQTVITEQPTSSGKQNVIPIITDPCIEAADVSGCSADLKNASFATACSEDSDEYRSLEHKDDADFAVSE
ncbi:RB1-inducible coiled-coil protein 1 [Zeugodacus cucurbitae]|uniref:RB1-inducible coiled-coil protein 1 n=1 Tax=Zeugodacus cucurbitae TaxID=28588 RepID=UPI0023D9665B|nr:RB1-inducible coiled-coil protein 1 [Zeugodacus cucurbitae]XP_054082012.1 RB1-inducible coiled-coil protein 1 [Zeugodacus cucurbitae]XP_054082013.1 RB1-inducible coiled-coil protein 1 [Zeugodacus cucurbitae]XP_054082014.1 RB1-inducible coiled-coil protein 1 [Zeugodacus cucurbitae]